MTPELLPLLVALFAGLGTLFAGLLVADWLTASSDRFASELGQEPAARAQASRVIRALGSTFSGLAAPFADMSARLDRQLMYAGRPFGGIGGREYLAATIVLSLLIAGGVGAFFALSKVLQGAPGQALSSGLWWFGLALPATAAFFILDVRSQARTNSEEIEREFPFFLDLAVLVVQAGGTPRKALGKYVEASPGTALAREIAITAKDADATSFGDAIARMIDRIQPEPVKVILKNLAQGEKSSGEAEAFYASQAEELRHLREEMANRTAERLKANIVFPVILLLIGVILAALAPTIVSIRNQGFF